MNQKIFLLDLKMGMLKQYHCIKDLKKLAHGAEQELTNLQQVPPNNLSAALRGWLSIHRWYFRNDVNGC